MGTVGVSFEPSWFGKAFATAPIWGGGTFCALVVAALWASAPVTGAAFVQTQGLHGVPPVLAGAALAALATCLSIAVLRGARAQLRPYVIGFRLEGTIMHATTPSGARTVDLSALEKVTAGGLLESQTFDVSPTPWPWRRAWSARFWSVEKSVGVYGPTFLLGGDDPDGSFFFLHLWMLRDGAGAIRAILHAAGRDDLGEQIAFIYTE